MYHNCNHNYHHQINTNQIVPSNQISTSMRRCTIDPTVQYIDYVNESSVCYSSSASTCNLHPILTHPNDASNTNNSNSSNTNNSSIGTSPTCSSSATSLSCRGSLIQRESPIADGCSEHECCEHHEACCNSHEIQETTVESTPLMINCLNDNHHMNIHQINNYNKQNHQEIKVRKKAK